MSEINKPIILNKEDLKIAFQSKRNYYAQILAIYNDLYNKTGEPALVEGMNYCLNIINDNWDK